ncbi:MAG: efflux RND transporter periplasmic adaptor subunit [Phycisphaerales bacterium]|nr:efflux RND transporter periplasmic adaptor subunit [Phycisphaerales bacterium]
MKISRIIGIGCVLAMAWCGPWAAGSDDHDHDHEHDHGHGETEHVDEVRLSAEEIARHGVKTQPVKRQSNGSSFTAPARVALNADALAHVGSPLSGRVVELKAKLGDEVKKGDVVLVLESAELAEAQGELLVRFAEVKVAEMAVAPAKRAYERAKKLFEDHEGIAEAEVYRRQTEWELAEGKLAGALAAQSAAENRLRLLGMDPPAMDRLKKDQAIQWRFDVRSPIDGKVIEREVTLGEWIGADRDALMVVADVSRLWVIAEVPESRLAEVSEGSAAWVEVAGKKEVAGKIGHVAAVLNAQLRTAAVRIELEHSDGLRAGMFVRARIGDGAAEGVLAVPAGAVQVVEGGPAVFVAVDGEENTFAKRGVKLGKQLAEQVEIVQGLKEGEQVVVEGAFILKAEMGKEGVGHEH